MSIHEGSSSRLALLTAGSFAAMASSFLSEGSSWLLLWDVSPTSSISSWNPSVSDSRGSFAPFSLDPLDALLSSYWSCYEF